MRHQLLARKRTLIAACLLAVGITQGQTWTWNADGLWTVDGNWIPVVGYPNGVDHVAQLYDAVNAGPNVIIDEPVTVGFLRIDDDNDYAISAIGSGVLTFDVSSGHAQITVTDTLGDGSHTISAPIVLNDDLDIDVDNAAGTSLVFAGSIGGTAGIDKKGAATAELRAACTYTGGTRVTDGTMKIAVFADRLPTSTHLTVLDPGVFDVNGYAQQVSALSGDGTVTNSDNVSVAPLFRVDGNADTTFSGVMTGMKFKLYKGGSSFLTLAGANTYGGGTTIDGPGGIKAGTTDCLPTQGVISITGVLDLNDRDQTIADLSGIGGTIRNTSMIANLRTLAVASGGFSGQIQGKIHLRKTGNGTLIIGGNNSYEGLTLVDGGTLKLIASQTIPETSTLSLAANATFDLNGFNQDLTQPSGQGTSKIENSNAATQSNLSIAVPSGLTSTFPGTISGKIHLECVSEVTEGAGTLVLTGNNTYNTTNQPSTDVTNGTLTINTPFPNGTESGTGPGNVLVSFPGVLNGNGRIAGDVSTCGGTLRGKLTIGGNVTNCAGKVEPGDSAGLIRVGGDFTQQAGGSQLNVEIGGGQAGTGYDQLMVTGTATLNGTLNITLINAFVPNVGASFVILTAGTRAGQFATINGTAITPEREFEVQYGNDNVTLVVVAQAPGAPAASEWGLGVLALLVATAGAFVFTRA